ncbi:MAG: hypothetical protein IKV54_01680 [Clostridia bacterium]|nr:hypothetical protein [Clostridia bacterium]
MMLFLFGCSAKKYKVDYEDGKFMFNGAKDHYRAGKKVVLYFDCIATDTNYKFYLDEELLNVSYDSKKGFVITFTMPDHDVKLRTEITNSMTSYLFE